MNTNQALLNQYDEDEIMDLLKNKEKLVYVDTGTEEIVARYKDLPDVIIDLNDKLGIVDLKVYDYNNISSTPILTTFGHFLNKCDSDVRKDIIDRLVKLQLEDEKVKDYKVIGEDMLEDIRKKLDNEMER